MYKLAIAEEVYQVLAGILDKKITAKEVKELSDRTGSSCMDCADAIRYSLEHDGCTPAGYLKAKSVPVDYDRISFEERVRHFSDQE